MRRCSPPDCVRWFGHEGACRPTWHEVQVCGAWLPLVQTTCARSAGHASGRGGGHRSRWAMDYDRDGVTA